jgi:hypothetical protein
MQTWTNPYSPLTIGELDNIGEQEHYDLAKRFLNRYNELLGQVYHPSIYPIQSTQVPRTSRSGNAFGFSLIEGQGNLGVTYASRWQYLPLQGPCRYEPFYVYSDSLSLDIDLRFFDNCPLYIEQVIDNNAVSFVVSGLTKYQTSYNSVTYLSQYESEIIARIQEQLGCYDWSITKEMNSSYVVWISVIQS